MDSLKETRQSCCLKPKPKTNKRSIYIFAQGTPAACLFVIYLPHDDTQHIKHATYYVYNRMAWHSKFAIEVHWKIFQSCIYTTRKNGRETRQSGGGRSEHFRWMHTRKKRRNKKARQKCSLCFYLYFVCVMRWQCSHVIVVCILM